MTVYTITPVAAGDAAELAHLRAGMNRTPLSVDDEAAYRLDLERFLSTSAGSLFGLTARAGTRLVGVGWISVVDTFPTPAEPIRRYGELHSVLVAAEQHPGDVAERIVAALLELAQASGLRQVRTDRGTPGTTPLLRRGWVQATERITIEL